MEMKFKTSKNYYGDDEKNFSEGGSWKLKNKNKITDKMVQFFCDNHKGAHPFYADYDKHFFKNYDTIESAAKDEVLILSWIRRDVNNFVCSEHSVNNHVGKAIVNDVENLYINKMNALFPENYSKEQIADNPFEADCSANVPLTEADIRKWYDKEILPLIPNESYVKHDYPISEYIEKGYTL